MAFMMMIIGGCKDFGDNPQTPFLPVHTLLSAPQSVVFEGKRLVLFPELYRAPSTGNSLAMLLHIETVDSTQPPSPIICNEVWIVRGSEVWASYLRDDGFHTFNDIERVADGGPVWDGPVDVIVSLVDQHGQVFLLRASNQPVRVFNA